MTRRPDLVSLTYKFDELDPDGRMKELILHIAKECEPDPTFNAVKLNKILYFSDFISYAIQGSPVTGAEYQRLPHGPAPKRLLPNRKALLDAGKIRLEKRPVGKFTQHRVVALADADLTAFSPVDMTIVHRVIRNLWAKTADEVSELSHGKAWHITSDSHSIPYQSTFLCDEAPSDGDIQRTLELNQAHEWEPIEEFGHELDWVEA